MSFCANTGFTTFGRVRQDCILLDDVLEDIGIDVFKYEKFRPIQFRRQGFCAVSFEQQKFEANTLGIRLLRRGVIGVSEVGYI